MSKSENLRRFNRKVRIWEQDQHCHWCPTLTVLVSPILRSELPDNAATLDHLYSKGDPRRRYRNKASLSDTVIACYACNHDRGKIQNRLARGTIGLLYADFLLANAAPLAKVERKAMS